METFFEVIAEIMDSTWKWFIRDPIDATITICVCLLITSCTLRIL